MRKQQAKNRGSISFSVAIAVAVASLFLTSCGSNTAKTAGADSEAGVTPNPILPPPTDDDTTVTQAPLTYEVSGYGNHPRHICVPAKTRLWLRVIPHANYEPLRPYHYLNLKYSDNTYVYDGNPAFYNRLRVRLSIPNTNAAWDYLSYNEQASVIGDYSTYLGQGNNGNPQVITLSPAIIKAISQNLQITTPTAVALPEYSNVWILGSDPYDGMCTYWEKQLGKCSSITSSLTTSNNASCGADQVKVLINNIVSDNPCTFVDKANWCKGGTVQTVPDYQGWSVTIKAVTEDTTTEGFLN